MEIGAVIEHLNRTRGLCLSAGYYSNIQVWRDWWKGYHKPFHRYRELAADGRVQDRQLYTLRMAKKVCEDWAALLLNEKTEITLQDSRSSEFVQGKDDAGGIFGACGFWRHANELVEKAFCTGTGALIVHADGMRVSSTGGIVPDADSRIAIDYLPAQCIIPLTVERGHVTEAAFCSEVLRRGEKLLYLETHALGPRGYRITNECFRDRDGGLSPAPLPEGVAAAFETGANIPLFVLIRPNIVNPIDEQCGLGVSVFAQAIDNLKGVDLGFNNFCRDFQLGGKKVFYDRSMVHMDDNGALLTPDDVCQQLFIAVGDRMPDDDRLLHEFNPELRVKDNVAGIQAQLDYLSFKVGLGSKHYRFDQGELVTATQYAGDRQELVQNVSKHGILIREALQDVVRAVLWAGRNVMGVPVNPETAITVRLDDSVVIDKEAERARDREDVRDGLMQKWEYRVRWYGEDEATAKTMVGAGLTDEEVMGFAATS